MVGAFASLSLLEENEIMRLLREKGYLVFEAINLGKCFFFFL